MMMFQKNPDKLESKALDYERRGKTAKAIKYREKAARLRGGSLSASRPVLVQQPVVYSTAAPIIVGAPLAQPLGQQSLGQQPLGQLPLGQLPLGQQPLGQQPLGQQPLGQQPSTSVRPAERYEQNALKWEQRGNWAKAQKNREKVWRLQNPQYAYDAPAPRFYEGNKFLGYNVPHQHSLHKQPLGMQQPIAFQQPIAMQQQVLQQGATIHHTLPPTIETHTHATIIEQTARPEKIVEVQPVIHREVEAPQVRIIEEHVYEQVRSTGPSTFTNAPIIEETVRPRIIEEIQPVVHREVPAPFVEHVEQHVTEHIVQPTTMTKEVLNDPTIRAPGFAAGGPVPLATAGGAGLQQAGLVPQANLQGQMRPQGTVPLQQNQQGQIR